MWFAHGNIMKTESAAKTQRMVIRLTMQDYLWLLLPNRAILCLFLGPLLSLTSNDPYIRSGGIILTVMVIIILLIHLSIKVNTRLIVYPFGIAYREPGCRIIARWKDIRRIVPRKRSRGASEELLVSKQSITEFNKLFVLRRGKHNLLKIPMTQFGKDWRITEWGKYVCNKAGIKYWR
jgi:hypothetical protein